MSSSSTRPFVGVHKEKDEKESQVAMPAVFKCPIQLDVIQFVHDQMLRNSRQAHAVSTKAGHQTSAESWGTGRAVARIPRVRGGGTHRSGQGAFGNMCRGGRMYAPIRVSQKWHKKINLNQKRIAITSVISASGSAGMIMSKGHVIDRIPEVPLVVSDRIQEVSKTTEAVKALRRVNAWSDVLKVYKSERSRAGVGKMRNRRKIHKTGPLIIYDKDQGLTKAFLNIPGVDTMCVHSMNLLRMAPGGHVGRFMIWSESAFRQLDNIFGTYSRGSTVKKGFSLPFPKMKNTDLTRLIKSDEIQAAIRQPDRTVVRRRRKRNPLVNSIAMAQLNPRYSAQKRLAKEIEEVNIEERKTKRERNMIPLEERLLPLSVSIRRAKRRRQEIEKEIKEQRTEAKIVARRTGLLEANKSRLTRTQKRNKARNVAWKTKQVHRAARRRKISVKKEKAIAQGWATEKVERPLRNPQPSEKPRPKKKKLSRYFKWYDPDTKPPVNSKTKTKTKTKTKKSREE